MIEPATTTAWRARSREQSFYDYWLEKEGIPVYRGYYIEDVYTLPLGDWARLGGRGAYLLLGNQQETDGQVLEIPPGAALNPERHLFEKIMFGLSGRGLTQVWQEGGPKHTFEWGAGSLFAIPLNTWHRHFNSSGTEPARLLAGTTAPRQLNQYHDEEFIFNNSYVFRDRFSGDDPEYYSRPGEWWGARSWETNFVPNANDFVLEQWEAKGAGARITRFAMVDGGYGCHIHELAPVTYTMAHRHRPGAMILVLQGRGYELLWYAGKQRERYELRPGSIVSPGNMQYHLAANVSDVPLRQFAIRSTGFSKYAVGEGGPEAHMSELIRYEAEDPAIRHEFYADCRSQGLEPVLMPLPQGG